MFTGIIETSALLEKREIMDGHHRLWLRSPIASELRIDQSVSHDGCCLTVDALEPPLYRVTVIEETLKKTTIGFWTPGYEVNLERALAWGGRLDGHWVQGHVDARGICQELRPLQGSWELRVGFEPAPDRIVITKGSIAVNGVSLTVVEAGKDFFTVHLIPYTFEHTNLKFLEPGKAVNVEFDVLGKYVMACLSRMQGLD
ncbi:MAG: riboflavin synthase [Flavobacteriales bacterium]|nr:riboflavin synthase [Flavobacteriales bacterium]MCX7650535.1 riboflavin synthase [Flavobacteriales bacterium]MDW8431743.1 riboflavin synthase [Flavobacteriales bacterium]